MDFVDDVVNFFAQKGYYPEEDLKKLAILDNQNAPLDGLSYQQQMMVAGFASSPLTAEELTQLSEILSRIRQKKSNQVIEELKIDE